MKIPLWFLLLSHLKRERMFSGLTLRSLQEFLILQVKRKSLLYLLQVRRHAMRANCVSGGSSASRGSPCSKFHKTPNLVLDLKKEMSEQDFLHLVYPVYITHCDTHTHTHMQHQFKQLCFKRLQRLHRN